MHTTKAHGNGATRIIQNHGSTGIGPPPKDVIWASLLGALGPQPTVGHCDIVFFHLPSPDNRPYLLPLPPACLGLPRPCNR
eukprot:8001002-Pyramimonas_sp.AAC.1